MSSALAVYFQGINRRFLALYSYGITDESIVGRKCHEISHRSDVPCHMNGEDCPHKQVFETRQPHQVLHIHYDTQAQPELP